jgi:membrane-bound serine protease (ClpP class)
MLYPFTAFPVHARLSHSRMAVVAGWACVLIGLGLDPVLRMSWAEGTAAKPDAAAVANDEAPLEGKDGTDADGPDADANKTASAVKTVMIRFHQQIDPLSGALLRRRYETAVREGAKRIVLDIDSPGGYLSTTLDLVRMIEEARDGEGIETIAYIGREAISGAAILALAADRILIASRGRIGDAGMIVMGEDSAFRYAPEKARSLLAQQIRDLASRHGRPEALAETMVDKDRVVTKCLRKSDGEVRYMTDREWAALESPDAWDKGAVVREASGGMFFTANGQRAVELGMADLVVDDLAALPAAIGVEGPVPLILPSGVDTLILILNSAPVTWLLLVIGLIALVIELGAPGVGLGGLISILCFGLFFWSRFLGGTSGWFEVILFLIGLVFIGLELVVIPGTGVAGISGVGMVLAALVLASRRVMMPESARDLTSLMSDVGVVIAALVGFVLGMMLLGKYLGELPLLSRLALAPTAADSVPSVATLTAGERAIAVDRETLAAGTVGVTLGPLRPSGKLRVGDAIFEVVTEGDFVGDGVEVTIVAAKGNRYVVRPARRQEGMIG